MSGATAGPWRVGDAGATVFGPRPKLESDAPTERIATLTRDAFPSAHTLANARLIAAAPALRDACKAIIAATEGVDAYSRAGVEAARNIARAALAALASAEGAGR